jgi:DNA processing protein
MDAVDLQLALGHARTLSATRLNALFDSFEADREQPRTLTRLYQCSPTAQRLLRAVDRSRVRADRAWAERNGIQLLDLWSADYPSQLTALTDAPPMLYLRGDATCLGSPQLAMAGSRRPTPAGVRTAHAFAHQLADAGLTITSGLAHGIDAASHEGALDSSGHTVAVLGSGLDSIYPPEHRALAERIAARGALVSELPPKSPPRRYHFPRRNRIISGLTVGVLIVEAAQHSGSLITAQRAQQQGRPVFAIPGSIHNPLARGCHALIRGGATLVEEPADVLRALKLPLTKQLLINLRQEAAGIGGDVPMLDKEYKILLDALGFEPTGVDMLVVRTGFASHCVAAMLLNLELEGAVGILTDGRYVRL